MNNTGRVVVVEEGWLTGGIGAEIVAQVSDACFGYLAAPPRRVAALDVPVPASKTLEAEATPDYRDIAKAVAELITEY